MILRVVKCGECFTVKSEKSDDGVLNKRTLVLQELREYNGQMFMDVVATELIKK